MSEFIGRKLAPDQGEVEVHLLVVSPAEKRLLTGADSLAALDEDPQTVELDLLERDEVREKKIIAVGRGKKEEASQEAGECEPEGDNSRGGDGLVAPATVLLDRGRQYPAVEDLDAVIPSTTARITASI